MTFREYSSSTQKTYLRIVEDFLNFTDKEAIYIRKEDIERYLDKNLKTVSTNTVL
ncbi:phage integrase N-terminal SAM-like domain-containing protein, partial [Fusobacterium sp.]